MGKAKKKEKEIKQPLERKDVKDGLLGVLNQMALAKPEKSEYWGVLDRLNTSDEDLILKTNLPRPQAVAGLYMIAEYYRSLGLELPATTLEAYLDKYMEARISKNGDGREGTLRVLENLGRNEATEPINEIMG